MGVPVMDTFPGDGAPLESFLDCWKQRKNLKSVFFRLVFLLKSVRRRRVKDKKEKFRNPHGYWMDWGTPQSRKALWGKEEQRNEREMAF